MKPGDKVYVAKIGYSEGVYEYTLEELGINRAIMRVKVESLYFEKPDQFVSFPLSHVFPTKEQAEACIGNVKPKVGDYVAVLESTVIIRGLVVKVNPKMTEILLCNEEDIRRNNGKMKKRYYHHQIIPLIQSQQQ